MQMNPNKWPVIKANENGKERSWAEAFTSSLKHRINNIRNQKHMQTRTGNGEVISARRWRCKLNHNNNILFPQRETGFGWASQRPRAPSGCGTGDPRVACSKRETGNGTANGKRDTEHLLHLPGWRSGDQWWRRSALSSCQRATGTGSGSVSTGSCFEKSLGTHVTL